MTLKTAIIHDTNTPPHHYHHPTLVPSPFYSTVNPCPLPPPIRRCLDRCQRQGDVEQRSFQTFLVEYFAGDIFMPSLCAKKRLKAPLVLLFLKRPNLPFFINLGQRCPTITTIFQSRDRDNPRPVLRSGQGNMSLDDSAEDSMLIHALTRKRLPTLFCGLPSSTLQFVCLPVGRRSRALVPVLHTPAANFFFNRRLVGVHHTSPPAV